MSEMKIRLFWFLCFTTQVFSEVYYRCILSENKDDYQCFKCTASEACVPMSSPIEDNF